MKTGLRTAAAALAVLFYAGAAKAETTGPNGESATPSSQVTMPSGKAGMLKSGGHTAAMIWHEESDFVNAVTAGARDEFKRLGIDVTAVANADGFDIAKLRSGAETVMAKKPDIILTLPFGGAAAAEAFDPARKAGVKLVFLSLTPPDWTHPDDYAAIVTDDLFQMGKQAADALAEAMGGKGTVGWIFHDAAFYVTNQRDNAFKAVIEKDYPGIKIVTEQGLADPARAEEIANAMILKNPDLGGIYAPWSGPAEGVLAALRANGNKTTKLVTLDLSEPIALDMVKGGNVVAIVADEAYELGRTMAAVGARALAGESNPPFVVAPALTIKKSNVDKGYKRSLNMAPPKSVMSAR